MRYGEVRLRDGERADNCTGCRCGKRADHRAGGVAVKETVSVAVEVRIERMPAYHPDPLWPDLESCPAGHIWAVCYSFDEGDYDICFSQTYVEGKVDWGDGESEDILNRYARSLAPQVRSGNRSSGQPGPGVLVSGHRGGR